MTIEREIVFGEVMDEFDLDGYINSAEEDAPVRFFEGDAQLKEIDLCDDFSIVVLGDLKVEGNIVGMGGESFLLVTGNCQAKNLLIGDPEVWIKGELNIENGILADYNHGCLTVEGNIKAATIVAEHAVRVGGSVEGDSIDLGGFNVKAPDWTPTYSYDQAVMNPKDLFVDAAFDDGSLSGGRLYDLLIKGESLIK